MDRAQHVPVLADRVTALLTPALAAEGAVLVDATLGRAGHARALLEACPGLLLVGIDADVAAIEQAGELLAPYAARVTLVHARYDEIPAIVTAVTRAGTIGPTASWACCSTWACPRRSSTTPSAASPTPRTPRSTCGWTAPGTAPPPTSSTATRPPNSPGSCASTARSGSPGGSPTRWSASAPAPRSPRRSG